MIFSAQAPRWRVKPKLRAHAQRLRRDLTDAERKLRDEWRAHRLGGASFRRQKPMAPYIVDFLCIAARIVVAVDGSQHFHDVHARRDARRDAYLVQQRYRVFRFTDLDVLTNLDGGLTTLATALDHCSFRASAGKALDELGSLP